jgi:hypothetical protein
MTIGMKPMAVSNTLTEKHVYKLKGVGPPTYHLGGDFFRDHDGTLEWGTSSYVKKILINSRKTQAIFFAYGREGSSRQRFNA